MNLTVSLSLSLSLLSLSLCPVGFDTSILPICKESLGWMFNKLDMNYDLLLDQSELSAIYLDKYELCMRPLFNSCDSFKDGKLSNNEWCYCFQKPDGELWHYTYTLYWGVFHSWKLVIIWIRKVTDTRNW